MSSPEDDFFVQTNPHSVRDGKIGVEFDVVELRPLKASRKVERYIARIPLNWHARASKDCGFAMRVANLLWYRVGLTKQRTVTLPSHLLRDHGIDRWAKARALDALENAGLIRVARKAGQTARVTVLDVKSLPLSHTP